MPVQAYASSLISLCQNLIRAKSLSGQEEEVISVLKNYFVSRGIQTFTTDEYGSLIVTVRGKEKGPVILFDGHVDTVPVPDPDSWTHPPFEGRIHGNRIYGRGSSDMKGAVSAMAVAACDFLEASRGNFAGSLVFAGVVQEEVFEGVAARSISKICDPDVVIIGEATGLQLNIGQRGRAEIQVETLGVPAHSANPEKGFNAVYLMTDAIRKIREITPPRHPVLGPGILELTDIKSSPYPGASVVPSRCLATYDRRLLPGETPESVLEEMRQALDKLSPGHPGAALSARYALGRETCYTGRIMEAERFFPGWLFEEDEWFIDRPYRALKEAGFDISLSHYNFCTNGSHYAGEAGIPTIGFGPSHESLAHTMDEYIEISQLQKARDGYRIIMEALLAVK